MDDTQPISARFTRFRSLGRALAHRNYRLFFAGQFVSMIGTWMTRTASSWLVFRLSMDRPELQAALLGIVAFMGQIPAFFLAPLAGVLVDRWNRHRLLVITQALSLIQSALLAALAFSGEPGMWTITILIFLNVCQGLINAFDMPARQAFMVEMIDKRADLSNAIALNSSLVNGARLVGPAIAGVLIYLTSEAWCFVIDAVSYVAVIIALLAMRIVSRPREIHHAPVWHGLVEGFRYAFGFAPIRAILLLLALISFMGMPYSVLMPIFASDLQGGSGTMGFMLAASGMGALVGALHLAARKTVLGLGRTIVFASAGFGAALVAFSLSQILWLSLLLLLVSGFGMMVEMAASNTILQTIVDENKRGRVMSFYTMAFLGMAPLGSLFAGFLAGAIGARTTVLIGGLACILGAALFAFKLPQLRVLVRPIYVERGILSQVASGLQTATTAEE
jgi:MFS family permease